MRDIRDWQVGLIQQALRKVQATRLRDRRWGRSNMLTE
jgi:hypothetical protein